MSDTVKLIVEIPKAEYELIVGDEACGLNPLTRAIAHGTPLDDVKAEIKEMCDTINHITSRLPYPTHRFVQEVLSEILESIGKESEVKPNDNT